MAPDRDTRAEPQHMTALGMAHAARQRQAAYKRWIGETHEREGFAHVSSLLRDPPHDLVITVHQLLMAVPRVGVRRAYVICRSVKLDGTEFLATRPSRRDSPLGCLTERQRLALASHLESL